ncbi:MAG: DUF4280 domain-containing protein [bacterium]|nr:DUF4280 domain-containing protein [bacterium]
MPQVVCQGAMCSCTVGSAPAMLTVTSQQVARVGGMAIATVMDFATGANLPPFGTCQILTAAASGTPTPCAMVPAGPWQPGSMVKKITGMTALTDASKLTCGVGGVISITNPANIVLGTK